MLCKPAFWLMLSFIWNPFTVAWKSGFLLLLFPVACMSTCTALPWTFWGGCSSCLYSAPSCSCSWGKWNTTKSPSRTASACCTRAAMFLLTLASSTPLVYVSTVFVKIPHKERKWKKRKCPDRVVGVTVSTYFIIVHLHVAVVALRNHFYREGFEGLYSSTTFLLAYTVHIAPFMALSGVIFSSVLYWWVLEPSLPWFSCYLFDRGATIQGVSSPDQTLR